MFAASRYTLVMLSLVVLISMPFRTSHSQDTPPDGTLESQIQLVETNTAIYYKIIYWSDGLQISGLLGIPKSDGPHPAIIYNRGGNRDFGSLHGSETGYLTGAGYVVAASQYRGGPDSEGEEEFGGADVHDVLNLLTLVENLPEVDADRIGMMGHSRGGMMTYLALREDGRSENPRIKAAVTVAGPTDLFDLWNARPDMQEEVLIDLIGASPEDLPAEYEARSAVFWPEDIHVPLLLLHGENDARVPVEEAIRLAEAIEEVGGTVQLITYKDDHGLSSHRFGFPDALDWFQEYLGTDGVDRTFVTNISSISQDASRVRY
jgi:dipeptidyl aminopeptidase/acylaminoacyl peptidase